MKRYDIYLAGAIIVIALAWFLIGRCFSSDGKTVSLYVDNNFTGSFDLQVDITKQVFDSEGNELLNFTVNDGVVDVISASCPDKLCVHQRPVSKSGESIVCLPQKIVLLIDSAGAGAKTDAVTY